MSFFRTDRALSHFLRHDPFSPFTRPALSPFYSPFFTVFDEPRGYLDYHSHPSHQPQLTHTSSHSKASPSHKADSQPQQATQSAQSSQASKEVSRTNSHDSQAERSPRRARGGRRVESAQPLSLLSSPFTDAAWPSLFNSALAPFAPLTAAVRAIPDITVDVHSTPQAYSIHASVPGMNKEDIRVTVDDGVLTIEAERKEARNTRPTTSNANANASSANNNASASSPSASSAASSSTPSTAGIQASAEMKEESKEEKTSAADATSSSNSTGAADNANASTAASSSANGASAMEEDPEDFHYTETFYGRVERSLQLPEDARVDELTAKYENGVLKIDIPRVQEQKTRGRRIEIQ